MINVYNKISLGITYIEWEFIEWEFINHYLSHNKKNTGR